MKQIEEINRPMNEELFNNLENQYKELANIKAESEQIEEMAKTMLEESQKANVEPVLEMEGKEVVLGENATKVLNNILEQAFIPFLSEALYNAGYRKQSEIAREIFEEIENALELLQRCVEEGRKNDSIKYQQLHDGRILSIEAIKYFVAKLKKKYTEG